MGGKKLWKLRKNEISKQNLYRVGQILDLGENEINTTLKKKKITMIIGILLTILAALMLSGCINTMYIAASIHDFSWLWRAI